MRLSDALSEDLIFCNLRGRTKEAALIEMIRGLVRSGKAADEDALSEAVLTRERLQSTGIGGAIAVPHGVTGTVRNLTCALGVCPGGLKYGAIDNRPVNLIFMFINNKARDVQYLALLASVCRLFEDEELRTKVSQSATARSILELIREREAKERYCMRTLPV
jgi:PTS system nitrogen regulatory IIA component